MESERAGIAAAKYVAGQIPVDGTDIPCTAGAGVRYVCPQHILADSEDCPVRLYFRVNAPGAGTRLIARSGKTVLASRTVPRVSPGEMEHLDLNAANLGGTGICVTAEEVE